jgi:hypothetical protein
MKKSLLILICTACIILSCKKSSTNLTMMRIQNNTTVNFDSVFSNGQQFGSITAGGETQYHSFNQVVDLPSAWITIAGDSIFIGQIYIDWPAYLKPGKYTMQVFVDTSTFSGYGCLFIKD